MQIRQEIEAEKAMKTQEEAIFIQIANYLVQENLLKPDEQIRFLNLLKD